jgi:hypothetical protein
VGALYTGGACAAAGIRGKDDPVNYGVGGALVGALYGLRVKRLQTAVYAGIVLGAVGVFCAYSEKVVLKSWESSLPERRKNVFALSAEERKL